MNRLVIGIIIVIGLLTALILLTIYNEKIPNKFENLSCTTLGEIASNGTSMTFSEYDYSKFRYALNKCLEMNPEK